MSSESLIAQYYQERYNEQMEEILPCKARLYVRVRHHMRIINGTHACANKELQAYTKKRDYCPSMINETSDFTLKLLQQT